MLSGAPSRAAARGEASIFSIFLNVQLCIERFFDSTTPKLQMRRFLAHSRSSYGLKNVLLFRGRYTFEIFQIYC